MANIDTNVFDETDHSAEIKAEYIKLLNSTQRPGLNKLLEFMEDSGFFTAPCSGGNHLCFEGGLVEHSLNVIKAAMSIRQGIVKAFPEYPAPNERSVILAAALHDLGKVGNYGHEMYVENVLKSGKISASKPYKRNPEMLPVPHAVNSCDLAKRYIDLTEQENLAILFHDGVYGELGQAAKTVKEPLQAIIHDADYFVCNFVETSGGEEGDDT